MQRIAFALCVFCLVPSLSAKTRKDIPPAPLPTVIVNAHKVFLSNKGGSDLAYDAFYQAMKSWGKYEIVGSPADAELIIELSYEVVNEGTRVWSSTNTYNNTTQVHSRQITDPQVILTIYDARTKDSLWSTTDHEGLLRWRRIAKKK